jgi:hypothetical protein
MENIMKKIILILTGLFITGTAFAQVPPPPVYGNPYPAYDEHRWDHHDHGDIIHHDEEVLASDRAQMDNLQARLRNDQAAYDDAVHKQEWTQHHGDIAGAQYNHQQAEHLFHAIQIDKGNIRNEQNKLNYDQRIRDQDLARFH